MRTLLISRNVAGDRFEEVRDALQRTRVGDTEFRAPVSSIRTCDGWNAAKFRRGGFGIGTYSRFTDDEWRLLESAACDVAVEATEFAKSQMPRVLAVLLAMAVLALATTANAALLSTPPDDPTGWTHVTLTTPHEVGEELPPYSAWEIAAAGGILHLPTAEPVEWWWNFGEEFEAALIGYIVDATGKSQRTVFRFDAFYPLVDMGMPEFNGVAELSIELLGISRLGASPEHDWRFSSGSNVRLWTRASHANKPLVPGVDDQPPPVPEPAAWLMAVAGLAGVAVRRRFV